MKRSAGILIALTLMMACTGWSPAHAAAQPPPKQRLQDGAPSIDTLLDKLQAALSTKDERALHRLRVTEQEYRGIIVPGTVKPGESPRQVADGTSEFFWSMLNQKSEDVGRVLIGQFGGHRFKRTGVSFTKGSRQFAWYVAHGNVVLQLEDEEGHTQELHTGAIAEVAGRYKFIGFNTK